MDSQRLPQGLDTSRGQPWAKFLTQADFEDVSPTISTEIR